MVVTPKSGWEKVAPTSAAMNAALPQSNSTLYRHMNPPLVSANQRQTVAALFASNVPDRSHEKLIGESVRLW
jgi:hypothetical protein